VSDSSDSSDSQGSDATRPEGNYPFTDMPDKPDKTRRRPRILGFQNHFPTTPQAIDMLSRVHEPRAEQAVKFLLQHAHYNLCRRVEHLCHGSRPNIGRALQVIYAVMEATHNTDILTESAPPCSWLAAVTGHRCWERRGVGQGHRCWQCRARPSVAQRSTGARPRGQLHDGGCAHTC
jgi:hypothetical protein